MTQTPPPKDPLEETRRQHAKHAAVTHLLDQISVAQRNVFGPKDKRQEPYWKDAFTFVLEGLSAQTIAPKRGGIVIHGKNGCGKTCLMIYVAKLAASLAGLKTMFLSSVTLDTELRAAYANRPDARTEFDILKDAEECGVIALDDVGAVNADHVARLHRALIDQAAAHQRFVVISTNLDDEQLWQALGKDRRELSRRANYGHIFFGNDVPDYRVEGAKRG